jgi:signal transduction histidine kinase
LTLGARIDVLASYGRRCATLSPTSPLVLPLLAQPRVDPREQHALGLEQLARARLPMAVGMLLAFLVGALPIELYYYPQHANGYVVVLGIELVLSGLTLLAVRLWPLRARAIATAWASVMGVCMLGYYPLVHGDATLALAALLCLISAMPAILPFGLWHQLILCGVCTSGLVAIVAFGVASALPWPYLLVSLIAVSSLSTIGASSLVRYRFEAVQREAVLRQAHENLHLALQRAEGAVEMRSRLVANVSHELRTPVNVIIGYADMVLDAVDDAKLVKSLARRIRQYAVSLDALIAELLDLSKLSCGKVDVAQERVDLRRMLDEVAHDCRLMTRGRPIAVFAECSVSEIVSDPMRLRQILNNLVTNAARATRSGRITVGAGRDGDWLALSVADTGCGIPLDKQELIFNAFEQAGTSGTTPSGIGLGLAIVRQLAEVLGGEVSVSSAPGAGATFTVRLPLVPRAAAPASAVVYDVAVESDDGAAPRTTPAKSATSLAGDCDSTI